MSQSAAHKNNKLLKAQNLILIAKCFTCVSLFKTLHTTLQETLISLTKAVVLPACTRNFFATFAMHCNNMPLQIKNTTIVYVFCLHHTL